MTEVVKLLRELIAIPSVNPAYVPEGSAFGGEGCVGLRIVAYGRKAGLDVDFQQVLASRRNVLVRMKPAGKMRKRVVLAPHLDTVGGPELPGKLFTPRVKGSRLYGRGACDTKGSVAAMLCALGEVARRGRRPASTEVVFAGLVDEECGQQGSRALVRSGLKADLAIVGEPTGLRVVTAHKGVVWLELQTVGRAAHGSHPELGVNAVEGMSRMVLGLLGKYAAGLRLRRHALLGHGTINVGAVQGGSQPNIVPAECRCLIDRRTLPGETDGTVMKEIEKLAGELKLAGFSCRNIQGGPCFPLQTDPRMSFVNMLLGCAGQSGAAGADFFSDAGVLSSGRVPSVLFGPGDIAQAHTPDEWVELGQVERAKDVLVKFLCQLP